MTAQPIATFETGKRAIIITRTLVAISLLASVIGWFIDVTGALAVPLVF